MAKKPPELVLEASSSNLRNPDYRNAHLAVASLTVAWHYILNVPNHDKTAKLIEQALESAAQLRGRIGRR